MMSMRFHTAAFYGLVFDGGEREGDWIERRDSSTLALPPYGDETFAIGAKTSMVRLDPYGDGVRLIPETSPEWDADLRAWCEATGRLWSQPRWWIAGAYL